MVKDWYLFVVYHALADLDLTGAFHAVEPAPKCLELTPTIACTELDSTINDQQQKLAANETKNVPFHHI